MFRTVVCDLLGWELDAEKEATGYSLQLLGLNIGVGVEDVSWTLNASKRNLWITDLRHVLSSNCLKPGLAAKFCGRFAFFERLRLQ